MCFILPAAFCASCVLLTRGEAGDSKTFCPTDGERLEKSVTVSDDLEDDTDLEVGLVIFDAGTTVITEGLLLLRTHPPRLSSLGVGGGLLAGCVLLTVSSEPDLELADCRAMTELFILDDGMKASSADAAVNRTSSSDRMVIVSSVAMADKCMVLFRA